MRLVSKTDLQDCGLQFLFYLARVASLMAGAAAVKSRSSTEYLLVDVLSHRGAGGQDVAVDRLQEVLMWAAPG